MCVSNPLFVGFPLGSLNLSTRASFVAFPALPQMLSVQRFASCCLPRLLRENLLTLPSHPHSLAFWFLGSLPVRGTYNGDMKYVYTSSCFAFCLSESLERDGDVAFCSLRRGWGQPRAATAKSGTAVVCTRIRAALEKEVVVLITVGTPQARPTVFVFSLSLNIFEGVVARCV